MDEQILNLLLEKIVAHNKPGGNYTQEQNHQGYCYDECVCFLFVSTCVALQILEGDLTHTVECLRDQSKVYIHKHETLNGKKRESKEKLRLD